MRVNMNDVARDVTLAEGGSVEISIAQVKEVLKEFLILVGRQYSDYEILELVNRYRRK